MKFWNLVFLFLSQFSGIKLLTLMAILFTMSSFVIWAWLTQSFDSTIYFIFIDIPLCFQSRLRFTIFNIFFTFQFFQIIGIKADLKTSNSWTPYSIISYQTKLRNSLKWEENIQWVVRNIYSIPPNSN